MSGHYFVCFISMKRQPYFPKLGNIMSVFLSDFSLLMTWIVKNHKILVKMNWFGTSLPMISSSQGFYKAFLWCSLLPP